MPNHCMNRIRMEFKDNDSKTQLKTDLEKLGDQKENLCQLVFLFDYETNKMTFPDGKTKVLKEGIGCPAGKYWGTKWGTYNTAIGLDENSILEYYFDTAWEPIDAAVLSELFKKYSLISIENNYWEPNLGFAGTKSSDNDGKIYDTEDDYDIIYVENKKYDDFVKLIKNNYIISDKYNGKIPAKALRPLFKKFKDFEIIYTKFEKKAYQALADTQTEPMLHTFITDNL